LIVFTYRNTATDPAARWKDASLLDAFFDTHDEARGAVLEMRSDITSASSADWSPFHIERVELSPIIGRQFLTLINKGIGPFVRACEIVETID
jgi:hypothetical protein